MKTLLSLKRADTRRGGSTDSSGLLQVLISRITSIPPRSTSTSDDRIRGDRPLNLNLNTPNDSSMLDSNPDASCALSDFLVAVSLKGEIEGWRERGKEC